MRNKLNDNILDTEYLNRDHEMLDKVLGTRDTMISNA
jgi:hypothetical protein